jgi:hypothetical protein
MKVKRDVPVTSVGIRKRTKWGRCIVLKGTSESERTSQRNVIRSRGTAVRNQTRTWAKRIVHVSAT